MKIAVIGANGQLGSDICIALKNTDDVVELIIDDIDISDKNSVKKAFNNSNIDMIINTAAFHNVEKCEDEPETAFKVNGLGSLNLAEISNELDIPIIHISTDYVFDGEKKTPYIETDLPIPLNVYGNTKLSGEYFISTIAKKYYVLRVSGIYGVNPCMAKGYNFVDLMIKLSKERDEVRVVDDEYLTPTYTGEIANQIAKIVHSDLKYGLYHLTAEGSCSWYEFAKEIFRLTKSDVKLNKAEPGEFAIKINRPKYSVLENKGLKDQNLNIMSHWKEGLSEYINSKQNI